MCINYHHLNNLIMKHLYPISHAYKWLIVCMGLNTLWKIISELATIKKQLVTDNKLSLLFSRSLTNTLGNASNPHIVHVIAIDWHIRIRGAYPTNANEYAYKCMVKYSFLFSKNLFSFLKKMYSTNIVFLDN